MHYWWVNHGQKGPTEVAGGYLWSPKRGKDGARIQYYENMSRAQAGEPVFSCFNSQIGHVGLVTAAALTAAKPASYGNEEWNREGWRLAVDWEPLPQPLKPSEIIGELQPWLPSIHSPIRANGSLNQRYLTEISREIFEIIMRTASAENSDTWHAVRRAQGRFGGRQGRPGNEPPAETERQQTSKVRIGQGLFRIRIRLFGEKGCRVTGVTEPRLLVASHIKPWRVCTNAERLDGANGLLLTPHVDRLFDRGLISFENDGGVKVSPKVTDQDLDRLGLNGLRGRNVGPFKEAQAIYLDHHRTRVFVSR